MTEARTPLVLLPGLLCDSALWSAQVEDLADKADIQVAELTQDDSTAAMARRVLSWAPERFALAGLSMGGYVAFEIMRQAPERVRRLALLDTRAGPDAEEQRSRRRGLIELARKGRFKGVTPTLLPMLVHEDRLADQALTDTVMAMAERIGRDAFIRQQTAILGRADSRPTLPEIAVPTLVLCGAEDALTPLEAHREMAGEIPDSELVVVPDCGHLSPLERPQAVTEAMRRWLA